MTTPPATDPPITAPFGEDAAGEEDGVGVGDSVEGGLEALENGAALRKGVVVVDNAVDVGTAGDKVATAPWPESATERDIYNRKVNK